MADEIREWLNERGLEAHAEAFIENGIDLDLLAHLTDGDLKELGVSRLGDRKRLLLAAQGAVDPAAPSPEPAPAAEAERRQITVLFCDMVGSTSLSQRLDPEDLRDLLRAFQDACSGVVEAHGGYLAKYMGDGVLVYFGYPKAREDDAERAVNAGLDLVAAVRDLGRKIDVRVGIATGRVVVGDLIGQASAQEAAISGETPNLAARLQEAAPENSVVIGDLTRSLAGDHFELDDLDTQMLKGFARPVRCWLVKSRRSLESRFDATHEGGLSPIVGRDEDIAMLLRRWENVRQGEGQTVMIAGEPGIGKSRLALELQERIVGEPHFRLRLQCSPYYTSSALYPVIERLERIGKFEADDTAAIKLAKLGSVIAPSGRPLDEVMPLFAGLLSIATGDRYPALNVSPQRRKELTLLALVDQARGLAARRPVLFIVEDAHWIDPTTLEFIELLTGLVSEAPVMLVVTHRPEFEPPWAGERRVTSLTLSRLEHRDCLELVAELAGQEELSGTLLSRISDQTDGVPLFIEEITKSVMETTQAGITDAEAIEVPASLHDSLAGRLDRLGPAKEVAQIGAVIGREFSYDQLLAVARVERERIDEALGQLSSAGLLVRQTSRAGTKYLFKHALIQGLARGMLLRDRRAELHGRVARHLNEQGAAAMSEVLAYHLTEAGELEEAVDQWLAAGRAAMQRSDNLEAEEHFRKGLAQLSEMPSSAENLAREVALLNALGVCMMPTRGFGNPEVAQVFTRAAEISERAGDRRALYVALRGLGQYQLVSGDLETTRKQVDVIVDLALELDDPGLQIEAHHLGWSALTFTGQFETGRDHAEAARSVYEPARHHRLTYEFSGHDPGVCCRSFGSLALWQLGFPDLALERCREGKSLADQLKHPFTAIIAWWAMGLLHVLRREAAATMEIGEALIRDCNELGFRPFVPLGHILRGGARTAQGEPAEGLAELRESIDGMRNVRTEYTLTTFQAWLADLCVRAGRPEDALAAVSEGLSMCEANHEFYCLAEFERIRAEAYLAQSDNDRAEAAFERALSLAADHGARGFGLRAAVSQARHLRDRGNIAAAHDCLSPVYACFTEGFDTPDLKAAKALLQELQA